MRAPENTRDAFAPAATPAGPSHRSRGATSARARATIALSLALAATLLFAPAARASLGVISSFGESGQGAGQLSGAAAVAVNRGGAGGVETGSVYVADNGNRRIDEFSPSGDFVRAFGWNAVAEGPDNVTPQNAEQQLEVPVSVTGGTFKLSFNGKTTASLPYNASAEAVRNALTALSSFGSGNVITFGDNVEVSGGPGATGLYAVTFINDLGDTPVPTIAADSSSLVGGAASVSVKAEGVSAYEICDVQAHPADVCQAGEGGVFTTQAGALQGASAIAVDQQTGAVYVGGAETNDRIDVYSATGEFEGAFAWGVVNGSRELQFCTTLCLPGLGGEGQSNGGAGQLTPKRRGVSALAPAPAGSPHEGDLYVADGGNNRIDEFKPAISAGRVSGVSFQRAFGWDVVESGPDNVPGVTEVQKIEIPASVTGGTFTVSFEGEATEALPYNASASALETALHKPLAARYPFVAVNHEVSGGPGASHPYVITFPSDSFLANLDIPQLTVDSSKLTGGTASVQTTTQGVSPNEVCDVADHPADVCKVGGTFPVSGEAEAGHEGQLTKPRGVAVDSAGTIYAVDGGSSFERCAIACRVEKFNPDGSFAGVFSPASLNAFEAGNALAPRTVAVDPSDDHVFVVKKTPSTPTEILELDGAGNLLSTSPPGGLPEGGIDFGNEQKLFVAAESEVLVLGPAPAPGATLGPVSNVSQRSATFSGTVTPPTGFSTFYHFEYSLDGVNWTNVPAGNDAAAGDGTGSGDPNGCPAENPPSCNVSVTVEGLRPGATYQVRLHASTGTPFTTPETTFETEAAAPDVFGAGAEAEESAATLTAFVNPNNRPTGFRFEWGTSAAYGNEAPAPEGLVGSGGEAVEVRAPIEGLAPNTTYHFRLIATNEAGETAESADHEFTTLGEGGLPDNRRPELVSPADKRPQGRVTPPGLDLSSDLTFQAADDGDAFYYPLQNGLLDSTAGGELRYLARRGQSGWSSTQVSAPSLVPSANAGGAVPSFVRYFSPDLSCGVIGTYQPLTADTPAADVELRVLNLYRVNPDGSYRLITSTVPSNPETGGDYQVAGASPDCSRVYFNTPRKLLSGASGLYEWDEGTLRDAGVLPDGTVPSAEVNTGVQRGIAVIGGNAQVNAVSRDGRRIFFTAISDEGPDAGHQAVFVREDGTRTVDASQTATATPSTTASYEIASRDGSHVFFTANHGLTASSSPSGIDLYSYNTETEALTDLSADSNPADSNGAAVEGAIDASEDGSYVYFAALGQLIAGKGNTYAQNLAGGGAANVYLSHAGQLSFVGVVAKEDLTEALASAGGTNMAWNAQATPDGKHLLYVTKADVTGYESGGVREAYLYSAESGQTVCVSCRRDGKPSLGTSSQGSPITGPSGETATPRPTQRSLSDDGSRVFFSMKDPLAPGAIAGNENLYEWERGQAYLLNDGAGAVPARIVGSSASGDDVFIYSTEQLDPHDTDFVGDVYDLRVNGGFPPPEAPPVPCDPAQDQCQGAPSAPPSAAPPASSAFSGPGNPPPTAPGKPKHKKKHRHGHKARHHAHARANHNRGASK
jgi:hypothetical protein